MKRIWKHYLNNTKLAHKFLYLLILLLVIEIVVSNYYMKGNAAKLLTREVRTTSKQFVEQYVDNIDYRLTRFKTLLNSLSSNRQLKEIFSSPSLTAADGENADREIRQILNNQFPYGLYNLAFYPLNSSTPPRSSFLRSADQLSGTSLIRFENQYFDRYFIHTEGSYHTGLLSILKPVYSTDGSSIVCMIELSLFPEKVFKSIKGVNGDFSHQLFLIDSAGNYIYGGNFSEMDEYLNFIHTCYGTIFNGYPVDDYAGKEGMYLTSTNSASGFRAVYYFAYSSSLESIRTLNTTLTVGILMLLLITLSAGAVLSISVNKRFSAVLAKIETVGSGNLKIESSDPGTDEIGIFDQSFTEMARQVDKLIESNYISEMKKKDAEFMALQAQINPHFLFNSLEIINSLIEIGRPDAACEVNARLSALLRYCINHNSSGVVTLSEEISYMNNYIYIQSMRFGSKFTYHTEIDEDTLNCRIIKLVFQPFIENSIKHGFSGVLTGGNIRFSVKGQEDLLLITISDDGNGMEETQYRSLMKLLDQEAVSDFAEQHDSIGILNIHYRLKLKFGTRYRIRIFTAPGCGMTTQITIPRI